MIKSVTLNFFGRSRFEERVLTSLRTRNLLIPSQIKQIGQELSKIQYFDNVTNKYKQSLLAQYKVPNLQVK